MAHVPGQSHASGYKLASYAAASGRPRAAIVVDEQVVDVLQGVDECARQLLDDQASVLAILEHWREMQPALKSLAYSVRSGAYTGATLRLDAIRLLAPVLPPGTIFCAGANYRDHVEEMSRALNLPVEPDPHMIGLKPWHFIKASASCIRETGARIALPAYSQRVDWEAEIALVIGVPCRDIAIADALSYVAGLTIVNDLSARDHLRRAQVPIDSPFRFDWVSQKCFDGALPIGPWITPLEDLGSPDSLGIKLWVNDELMQDSSSANLIFSFAEQVSHLSSRLTLRPGDVIATGTPAGCGAARGKFLQPGDRVRIWVESIGELLSEFTA